MSGNKKLAEARILAAKQVPYMRAGLMSLMPVERPGLGTMAMDQYGRLYYDPTFLEARSPKHNAFVVIHEYVHYHQRHAQRQKAIVQSDPAKLEVWRGTVEGPTNEIVESCFGWCPEEATTSEKLGLPSNLTVEEAFAIKWKERCEREEEAQRQRRQEQQEENDHAQEEDQDEHERGDQEMEAGQNESQDDDPVEDENDESGANSDDPCGDSQRDLQSDGVGETDAGGDDDRPGEDREPSEVADEQQDGQAETESQEPGENGQGQASDEDATCAGDGTDGAAGEDSNDGPGQDGQREGATGGQGESQGTLSPEALSQLAQDIGGSACDGIQRPWEFGPPDDENPGLSESDQDMIEATIAKAIEAHVAARGEGSVAAALVKQASELLHKPVDPCRELAAMTKYAVDTIAGFGEFTYARPSNRQIPGGCLLPSSVKPIPRITLIIDSSGSMGSDDTALALEVLGSVLKHLPDPRGLRVLVGGTRVEAARRVFKPEQIAVLDGGGTDMGCLIRQAGQEKPAPKVILCVTDGETPWCAERDVNATVMVCLTRKPRWCSPPPSWMKVICLYPDAAS